MENDHLYFDVFFNTISFSFIFKTVCKYGNDAKYMCCYIYANACN